MSEIFLKDRNLQKPDLFFKVGSYNGVVQIRRTEEDVLWVDNKPELLLQEKIECYVVAKDDKGIFMFVARVTPNKSQDLNLVDVLPLTVVPGSHKLVNRREFVRLENLGPHQLQVWDAQNNKVPAKLVNLSASGARIEIEGKGSMEGFYNMDFKSDWLKDIHIQSAFKVIHTEASKESQRETLGVIFLKNIDKKIEGNFSNAKQQEMVRWMNSVLIEHRHKAL